MTVNIGDVVRVSARMLRGGLEDFQNIYHFEHKLGGSVSDALFVTEVTTFLDGVYFAHAALANTNITAVDVLFFNVTQGIPMPDGAWTLFVGGTTVGQPESPQVSQEVYWRTGRAGAVARKFLWAPDEVNQNDGLLSGPVLAILLTFANAFVGDLVLATITVVMGTFQKTPAIFSQIVQAFVPVTTRTQRRRRSGVGG